MQVLAINQNATIERLVSLSSGKMGYTLKQYPDVASAESGEYNFVIIDSELYSDGDISTLKTLAPSATHILIASKNIEKPNGFDVYLEKPFLPTELVEIYLKYQDNIVQDADDAFSNEYESDELEQNDDTFDTHINLEISDEHSEMAMPSFDVEPSDLEPIEEEFDITIPDEDESLSVEPDNQIEMPDDELVSADELVPAEDSEDSDDFTFNLDSVIDSNDEVEELSNSLDGIANSEQEDIELPDFGDTEVDVFGTDLDDTETSVDDELLSGLDNGVDLPELEGEDEGFGDFMSSLHEDEQNQPADELTESEENEPIEEEFNFDDMLEKASAELSDNNEEEASSDDLSIDGLNLDDSELDLNFDDDLKLDGLDDISSDISVDDLNLDDSELNLNLEDDFSLGGEEDLKEEDTLLPEISDLDLEMPSEDDLSEDIDFKFDTEEDDLFASQSDEADAHSILDEQDVNEIKDLLDVDVVSENENEPLDDLALDLENTDVDLDVSDIDSLSEEMMASALGVDIDDSVSSADSNQEFAEEPASIPSMQNTLSEDVSSPEVVNLINALKAALADNNVTINISITKNG